MNFIVLFLLYTSCIKALYTLPREYESIWRTGFEENVVIMDDMSAMRSVNDRHVHVVGNSVMRHTFWAMRSILEGHHGVFEDIRIHGPIKSDRLGTTLIGFQWLPYMSNISSHLQDAIVTQRLQPNDVLIVGTGLHDLLYNYDEYDGAVSQLTNALTSISFHCLVVFITQTALVDDRLSGHRVTTKSFRTHHAKLKSELMFNSLTPWATSVGHNAVLVNGYYDRKAGRGCDDGVHSKTLAKSFASKIFSTIHKHNYLHQGQQLPPPQQQVGSDRFSIMLFKVTVVAILLYILSIAGSYTLSLGKVIVLIVTTVCVSFVNNNDYSTNIVSSGVKISSPDITITLCFISFITCVVLTINSTTYVTINNNKIDLFPRWKMELWKITLTFILIVLNYYHDSNTSASQCIHQIIQSCFVVFSAYNHTVYFIDTNDFSMKRVVHVLLRLNIGAIILSVMCYNNYMYYTVSSVYSLIFLTCFTILRQLHTNRFQCVCMLFTITVFVLEPMALYVGSVPPLSSSSSSFVSIFIYYYLDQRYMICWGVLIALYRNEFHRSIMSLKSRMFGSMVFAISLSLTVFIIWLINSGVFTDHGYFALTHSYFGILPVLLLWITQISDGGSVNDMKISVIPHRLSLYMFLLQSHILMTHNGRLRLLLLSRPLLLTNFLLCFVMFMFVCTVYHHVTTTTTIIKL